MSLFGEYGTSKIGSAHLQILAATTWTEFVLVALNADGSLGKSKSFVVTASGDIYACQAVHSLKSAGVVVTLPVDPTSAGSGPGYHRIPANVPWRIDVERPGENSLYVWAAVQTSVIVTELTATSFDDS
jgi:hypothetical protein